MKNANSRKYLWLVAIIVVAIEVTTLLVKTSRTYGRETANADLIIAIARCRPVDVQNALDRGADATRDERPRRSFMQVLLDTLQRTATMPVSGFNSSPLSSALTAKPALGEPVENWRRNHLKIVTMLLNHGAAANGHPGFDFSPLYLAATSDDAAATLILLEHGADANGDTVPNSMGIKSPMFLTAACRNVCGDKAIVDALLQYGARIDCTDNAGQTALMLAAQLGDVNMVTHLISRHAQMHLKDRRGRTAADDVPINSIPPIDRDRLLTLLGHAH